MRALLLMVLVLGCGKSGDSEPAKAGADSPAPQLSERDKLVAAVQYRIGSENLAKASIEGPALIIDARRGQDECRAMINSIELRFRARLHAAQITTVRCITTKLESAQEVLPL